MDFIVREDPRRSNTVRGPDVTEDCGKDGSRKTRRSGRLGTMIGPIVHVMTWPFRAVVQAIDWMGRAASLLLGFLLMVGGAALLAGPWMLIGGPIFLVGLFLLLKALG